jgi:hypothetical protein
MVQRMKSYSGTAKANDADQDDLGPWMGVEIFQTIRLLYASFDVRLRDVELASLSGWYFLLRHLEILSSKIIENVHSRLKAWG